MPNHITNIINFAGDPQTIQKMLHAIYDEEDENEDWDEESEGKYNEGMGGI